MAASLAFLAISLMLTAHFLRAGSDGLQILADLRVALETIFAWAEVSSELAVICWLVLESFLAGGGHMDGILR